MISKLKAFQMQHVQNKNPFYIIFFTTVSDGSFMSLQNLDQLLVNAEIESIPDGAFADLKSVT